MNTFYILISVFLVSLTSIIGIITLGINEKFLKRNIFILVSLAVGALLGDAFIHLIPEAFEEIDNHLLVSSLIISGIFIFFILEKFMHWHHHEIDHHNHQNTTGKMILVSDGLHNFIDGIIIASSYLISVEVGIATTIAVVIHEIPQEIGDFGVLIHAGYSKVKALLFNFLSALLAVFGALLVIVIGSEIEELTLYMLPIAAGGFIYIAIADLMPELKKEQRKTQSLLQTIFAILGVLIMYGLIFLE